MSEEKIWDRHWLKGNDSSSARKRFAHLITAAKKRNHEVTITYEDYLYLITKNCYYCGSPLPRFGHGIDRINSDIGYVTGNVRPCCTHCNIAKNDWTEAEFREWVLRVYNRWADKK